MQQQPNTFTIPVSERSLRRVQITMTALSAADQTARAGIESLQGFVGQARKSLDDALGTICDAHDQTLPAEYSVSLDVAHNLITITSAEGIQAGAPVQPPGDALGAPAYAPMTIDLAERANGLGAPAETPGEVSP